MAHLSLFYFDYSSVNIIFNDNLGSSMDNFQKLGTSKKVKYIHIVQYNASNIKPTLKSI